MTQIINDKLKKCCNQCHKYMDGHCAWLSLGNEYCDEIMNVQQELERLHSIIKEVREYIEEHTTHYTSYLGKPKVVPKIELQREAYDRLIDLLDKVSDK